jgi:hypothetical protein
MEWRLFWRPQVRWRCQELPHPHRPKPDDWLLPPMGATPATGPTRDTHHPTPMPHIVTVTPGIAGARASTFTSHPHTTTIGMADPDISIMGITAGIVIGKVVPASIRRSPAGTSRHFRSMWTLIAIGQSGHRPGRANQARFMNTRPSSVRPKTDRSR